MKLPVTDSPYTLTFRFYGRKSDALKHLLSAFYSISMNQPDYRCISHYREIDEHAFVIESDTPVTDGIRTQIRNLLQYSPFVTFISETETKAS